MNISIITNVGKKSYKLESFNKDVVSFGRSSECDIQIMKEYVSRVHGCFYRENGKWYIKDLESTNGLILKDRKIDSAALFDEDVFRINKHDSKVDSVRILVDASYDVRPASTSKTNQGGMQQNIHAAPIIPQNNPSINKNNMTGNPRPGAGKKSVQKKSNKTKYIILFSSIAAVLILTAVLFIVIKKPFGKGGDATPGDAEYSSDGVTNIIYADDKTIDEYSYNSSDPYDALYEITDKSINYDESEDVAYINNIIVVCFDDKASDDNKKEILKKYGKSVAGQSDTLNEVYLRVDNSDLNALDDLADKIEGEELVELAKAEVFIEVADDAKPDDPWKNDNDLSTENNEESNGVVWNEKSPLGNNWYLEAVDARGAWEYEKEMDPVTVGVIDEELDFEHEDLTGKLRCLYGSDYMGDSSTYESSHGTHVSGIIASERNNKKGASGVSGNAKILFSCKDSSVSKEMCSSDDVYDQLRSVDRDIDSNKMYTLCNMVKNDAKVINMSFGLIKPSTDNNSEIKGLNRLHSDEYTNKMAFYYSRGIGKLLKKGYDFVVVQSAGNGAENGKGIDAGFNGFVCSINASNCYNIEISPDDILNRIIVVGSAQKKQVAGNTYQMTAWSNGGSRVDICAPGEYIYSTIHPYDKETGYYGYMSGTSMSAPIVSGVCAMTWGADPKLTGAEVKSIVCDKYNTIYAVQDNPDSPNASGSYRMVNARLSVEEALRRAGKESLIKADDTKPSTDGELTDGGEAETPVPDTGAETTAPGSSEMVSPQNSADGAYVVSGETCLYSGGSPLYISCDNDINNGILHDIEVPRIGDMTHPEYRFLYPGVSSRGDSYYLYRINGLYPIKINKTTAQDMYEEYSYDADGYLSQTVVTWVGDETPELASTITYNRNLAARTIDECVNEPSGYNFVTTYSYTEDGKLARITGDELSAEYGYEEIGDVNSDYYDHRVTSYSYTNVYGSFSGTITYDEAYNGMTGDGWIYVNGNGLDYDKQKVEIFMEGGLCKQILLYDEGSDSPAISIDYTYEWVSK